jgi:4-amino-4-deoxy-L-arabinose transferase-like glycosyltransferase
VEKRIVIIAISFILFFANLGGLSIYILDEAKNSTAAKEMFNNGDFVVPTFNHQLRTDKPPLHYYFMMLSYSIFGVNEFGARFFSAIAGIVTVLLTFLFTRKFVNETAAFFAALVMLSSIQVIIQFHMAAPDPYLVVFLTVAIFCFYTGWTNSSAGWLWAAYSCVGLATLAKGPVAIILFGIIAFAFLISQRSLNWNVIAGLRPISAIAIVLLIALPWYVLVHIQTNGAWTEGFFLKHNINRFVSPMEGHGGSFLLIPVFAFLGLFPLSIFFPQMIAWLWKKWNENSFITLALISAVIVLIFFSFSQTKLPNYIAPSLPFLAIILGTFLSSVSNVTSFKFKFSLWIYFIIALVFPIAICLVLEDVMNLPLIKNVSMWFLVLPIGAALALILMYRERVQQSFYAIAGSWVIVIFAFFTVVYPSVDNNNPVVKILQVIQHERAPVYYSEKYNPSFAFYLKGPLHSVDTVGQLSSMRRPFYILSMRKNSEQNFFSHRYKIIFQRREFFEPYYSVLLYHDASVSSLP